MNIENERKAFELVCYPNAASVSFYDGKYHRKFNSDWQFKTAEHANHLFRAWIIAKEHAAEMARKGCVLQYDGAGDWWIVIPGVMRQGTYATKEEAEQRAVLEGLRIDTPKTEFLDVY